MSAATADGKRRVRIIVADDHDVMRAALRCLLTQEHDMEVVAEAADGNELLHLATDLVPDIVVMDVSMPNIDGAEATRRLRAIRRGIRVLALSGHADDGIVRLMINAGASGYLVKSAGGREIVRAIRTLALGGTYLTPDISY